MLKAADPIKPLSKVLVQPILAELYAGHGNHMLSCFHKFPGVPCLQLNESKQ